MKSLLKEIKIPSTAEEIAKRLRQPLHKVSDSLREMIDAGFVASYKGQYIITEKGKAILFH